MSETYTVTLNGKSYELNKDARRRIQNRAESEYEENWMLSCWWKTASKADAEDEDTVHEVGDPILVIETEGPIVPWERLDQLEIEEQTTDSFQEFDNSGDSGMRTVKPDEEGDEEREKERTHFGITPQEFEEVPSPDGEDSDKVPAKADSFDEPKMVMFVPDNPEIEHTWSAGEAMSPMTNWVEWNVQQKANQPRLSEDGDGSDDSHDHWESILSVDDCEVVGEESDDILDKVDEGPDSDDEVEDRFKHGKNGGGHWNV